MNISKEQHIIRVKDRLILIPVATLLYMLISFMIYHNEAGDYTITEFIPDFLWTALTCVVLIETILFYNKLFFKYFFRMQHLSQSLLIYSICLTLTNITIAYGLSKLVGSLIIYTEWFPEYSSLHLWKDTFTNGLIISFIASIYSSTYYINHWKKAEQEKFDLEKKVLHEKEILTQAQLVSLKLQIDPHFMFNNFSILSGLIAENPETAGNFLEHLSKVYRYIIQNLNHHIVPIKEELRFLRSYIYLIRIRHPENIKIEIEVDDNCLNKGIPPAVLQLLVENAIKHNKATKEVPLTIEIKSHNNKLIVANNLNPMTHAVRGTKIGQKNIWERYILLGSQQPVIDKNHDTYQVTLPLLEITKIETK